MKNKLITASFLCFLILVSLFFFPKSVQDESFEIIQVIEADKFYIDLNKNSKSDNNELFKLQHVNAFYPIKNDFSIDSANRIGITLEEFMKVGLIAKDFAKDKLLNKRIKILQQQNDRISFEIDGYNYEDLLLKNGLAFVKNDANDFVKYQFQNIFQIKENAKAIKNNKIAFLDFDTNTLHSLNCKSISSIKYGELVFLDELKNKNLNTCSSCFNKFLKQDVLLPAYKKTYKNSFYFKEDDFEFFVVNPLEYNKPNPKCETKICKTLVNEINKATKTIDVAVYGIHDVSEILNALNEAKNRGLKVRIVYQCDKNIDNVYPQNLSSFEKFDSICNYAKNLMHNKFFIFDNNKVFTGSTNITSSGIGGYNSNISVLIDNKNIAELFKAEFEQMFRGKFSSKKAKIELFDEVIKNTKAKIAFSPKGDVFNSIILPEILNAKKEILVSAFYLTDDRILDELIKAKKRNVQIFVILDSLCASNFKNKAAKLRSNGIVVAIENWGGKNHEKTIVIDSQKLILGSSNFSKSGFSKNDENVIFFENSKIANSYRDYFLFLINSIDKKFLNSFARAESLESGSSCFDGIDNNYDGKIDKDDVACKVKNIKKSN